MTTATATAQGAIIYDTVANALKVCDGTNWSSLGGSGASASGTAGYIQISGGSGAFTSDSTTGGQLFWDTTNHRLGIGTTAPTDKLDIAGNSVLARNSAAGTVSYSVIYQENGTSYVGFQQRGSTNASVAGLGSIAGLSELIAYGTGGLAVYTQGAKPLILGTSNTDRLHIDTSGNVGIGTTNPSYLLDVAGSARFGKAGAPASVLLSRNDGVITSYMNQSGGLHIGESEGGGYIAFEVDGGSHGTSGAAERMRIDSSGNVGIGTTSPSQLLDISDGSGWTRSSGGTLSVGYTTGQPRVLIERDVLGSGGAVLLSQSGESITQYGAGIGIPSQRSLALITSDGTSLVERVRVDSTGKVGHPRTS